MQQLLEQLVIARSQVIASAAPKPASPKAADSSILGLLGLSSLVEFNNSQAAVNKEDANTEKWLTQCIDDLANLFRIQVQHSIWQ